NQTAIVCLVHEARKHRRPAGRFELVLGLAGSSDENLDDQRLAGGAAPRMQLEQLAKLLVVNRRLVVGPVTDEDLDEGAGERAIERLGRPRERERARFPG